MKTNLGNLTVPCNAQKLISVKWLGDKISRDIQIDKEYLSRAEVYQYLADSSFPEPDPMITKLLLEIVG